jgi:rod shape determining protein RodA
MTVQGAIGQATDRIGGRAIESRMARRAPQRHIDVSLVCIALTLAAYGAVMVWSATERVQQRAGLDPNAYLTRQLFYLAAGVGVAILLTIFEYRYLKQLAAVIYGATLAALLLVLTPLGTTVKGATRWINFGVFQFQPSEVAKVALVVTLAALLSRREGSIRKRDIGLCLLLVGGQSLLIYKQPDLGTMIVLIALLGALLLVAGTKIRHLLGLIILGLVAAFMVIQAGLLADYQLQRITAFLDPTPDVQSVGYNLTQSKIAIGSGGIRGKGLAAAKSQTSLDYVPEQHTDFIFTAVGEQLGFIGSAVLLGLFVLLIWRALRIATLSRDMFGTLLAAGIAALWAFQVFVNIGMTMGIMPITGIPLPFISYGGSSLITNLAAVGLLVNVHMRRFL